MFNGWTESLLAGIQTLNQILTAGIAITAFSLFLYALSFNLRDRVARSFAIILLGVVVVFTTDALQSKDMPNWGIDLLLRLQWIGIVFLPAAYLHLSDALLVTAGRPSRGRQADRRPINVPALHLFPAPACNWIFARPARPERGACSSPSADALDGSLHPLLYCNDDFGVG